MEHLIQHNKFKNTITLKHEVAISGNHDQSSKRIDITPLAILDCTFAM